MAGHIVSVRVKQANGGSIRCHICVPLTYTDLKAPSTEHSIITTHASIDSKVPTDKHMAKLRDNAQPCAPDQAGTCNDAIQHDVSRNAGAQGEPQAASGHQQFENGSQIKDLDGPEPDAAIPEPLFTIHATPRKAASDGETREEDWIYFLREYTGNCHIYSNTFVGDINQAFKDPDCVVVEKTAGSDFLANTSNETPNERISGSTSMPLHTNDTADCIDGKTYHNTCNTTSVENKTQKPESRNETSVYHKTVFEGDKENEELIVEESATSAAVASESSDILPVDKTHQHPRSGTKAMDEDDDPHDTTGRPRLNSSSDTESCCSLDNLDILNNDTSTEISPLKVTLVWRKHISKDSTYISDSELKASYSHKATDNKNNTQAAVTDGTEFCTEAISVQSSDFRKAADYTNHAQTDGTDATEFYTETSSIHETNSEQIGQDLHNCNQEETPNHVTLDTGLKPAFSSQGSDNVRSNTYKVSDLCEPKQRAQQTKNRLSSISDHNHASKNIKVMVNGRIFRIITLLQQKKSAYQPMISDVDTANKENSRSISRQHITKRKRKGLPQKRKRRPETDNNADAGRGPCSIPGSSYSSVVHESPGLTITKIQPPYLRTLEQQEVPARRRARRKPGAKSRRFPPVNYSENKKDENSPLHEEIEARPQGLQPENVFTYKFVSKTPAVQQCMETKLSLGELLQKRLPKTPFQILSQLKSDSPESTTRPTKDNRSKNKSTKRKKSKAIGSPANLSNTPSQNMSNLSNGASTSPSQKSLTSSPQNGLQESGKPMKRKIHTPLELASAKQDELQLLTTADSVYTTAHRGMTILEQQAPNKDTRENYRELKDAALYANLFSDTIMKGGAADIKPCTWQFVEQQFDGGRLPDTLRPVYEYALMLCDERQRQREIMASSTLEQT